MPTKPFYFALEFSSQGASAELLGDLATHVLEYVGSSPSAVPELTESLQKAVAQEGVADRRCDVQFRLQPGKLEIVVSANGGRVWQTALPVQA